MDGQVRRRGCPIPLALPAGAIAVSVVIGVAVVIGACGSSGAPPPHGQTTAPAHGPPAQAADCGTGGRRPAVRSPGPNPFTGTATPLATGLACAAGPVRAVFSTGAGTFSLELSAPPCSSAAHCLRLSGTVTGTVRAHRTLPDVGVADLLTGHGSVAPLGSVSLSGAVSGTGFIARGRERLQIVLRGSRGAVRVLALSRTVAGFTRP